VRKVAKWLVIGVAAIFALANLGGAPSGLADLFDNLEPLSGSLGRWVVFLIAIAVFVALNLSRERLITLRMDLGFGGHGELLDELLRQGQDLRDKTASLRHTPDDARLEYQRWFIHTADVLHERVPAELDGFLYYAPPPRLGTVGLFDASLTALTEARRKVGG
jgi:hypothetical protein